MHKSGLNIFLGQAPRDQGWALGQCPSSQKTRTTAVTEEIDVKKWLDIQSSLSDNRFIFHLSLLLRVMVLSRDCQPKLVV